jgi:hypothetical protein
MTGVLQTAIAFASRRHAVLPLWWPVGPDDKLVCACGRNPCGKDNKNAAKHPHKIVPHGLKDATTDIGVVKHWFGYLLPSVNLGICTDNLLVIDIDPRHGGDESRAALEHECALPETWRVQTGGGGQHIILAVPEGVTLSSWSAEAYTHHGREPPLGPGIDVRARGGYIVGVGSRHISGRFYNWLVHPNDTPLAPAPEWLVERLTASTVAADGEHEPMSSADWQKLLKPASKYPDDIAFSIVGHMFAHGIASPVVLGLMQPWERENGLDQKDLETIIDKVGRAEAAERRKRLARWQA